MWARQAHPPVIRNHSRGRLCYRQKWPRLSFLNQQPATCNLQRFLHTDGVQRMNDPVVDTLPKALIQMARKDAHAGGPAGEAPGAVAGYILGRIPGAGEIRGLGAARFGSQAGGPRGHHRGKPAGVALFGHGGHGCGATFVGVYTTNPAAGVRVRGRPFGLGGLHL